MCLYLCLFYSILHSVSSIIHEDSNTTFFQFFLFLLRHTIAARDKPKDVCAGRRLQLCLWSEQLNGLMQDWPMWLFRVFSFKSAWFFACAFIFLAGSVALCFWEKRPQNIEAWTMNVTKRNKCISAKRNYRKMFYYSIEKHMKKFRHFWREKNFTWKSH